MAADATTVGSIVALVVAGVGFAGAVGAAVLSRTQERRQQVRVLLIDRAQNFATATHAALAELRHITPPRVEGSVPHRNLVIVSDQQERLRRLERVRAAMDRLRAERAGLPLVFGTRSQTAEWGRRVLAELREAQEQAEHFYYLIDRDSSSQHEVWSGPEAQQARRAYKMRRAEAYAALTQFYEHAAWRVQHPDRRGEQVAVPTFQNPTEEAHERRARTIETVSDDPSTA